MQIIKTETDGVFENSGRPVTSSRRVAEYFGKRHDDVLKAIRNLECSGEFRLRNFAESSYKNEQKKRQPEYLMTRDGFIFLVMGFTGKKAARIKEAYINAFNQMESLIKERLIGKLEYPALTDAIQAAHDPAKFYHFSNEMDMINRIVLGMSAKQFRDKHKIEEGSIRPYLSELEIYTINLLQRVNTELIEVGFDFETRKECLTRRKDKTFAKPPKMILLKAS